MTGHLSADAVFLVHAGAALCRELQAENEAAMRELADERTQTAALRSEIERLLRDAAEANKRAGIYHTAMLDLHKRCNALAAENARHMKRAPVDDIEALRILARAHGMPLAATA